MSQFAKWTCVAPLVGVVVIGCGGSNNAGGGSFQPADIFKGTWAGYVKSSDDSEFVTNLTFSSGAVSGTTLEWGVPGRVYSVSGTISDSGNLNLTGKAPGFPDLLIVGNMSFTGVYGETGCCDYEDGTGRMAHGTVQGTVAIHMQGFL